MAILGLGILIATITYLYYRNAPTTWKFLPWTSHQVLVGENAILQEKYIDDKQGTRSSSVPPMSETIEDKSTTTNTSEKELSSSPLIMKTSAKNIEDRKAMPPPSLLHTTSKVTLDIVQPSSSPTTPKANAATPSSVPSFLLSNEDEEDSQENEQSKPTSQFPALRSPQRASAPSTRINTPPLPSQLPMQPPVRTANLMSPPIRSPLPNRLIPDLDPGRNISNPITKTTRSSPNTLAHVPSRLGGKGGLAPPPSHNTIPMKPRQKVQLTPGHSPLDWADLSRSPTANLNGLPPNMPYLRVPPSLLKQMNGRPLKDSSERSLLKSPRIDEKGRECKDAWTVLSGKVYNITAYLPYHPGGVEETLKCAGRDGTKLFGEVHPWVNWENMLEGCLVGVAISEEEHRRKLPVHTLDDMD